VPGAGYAFGRPRARSPQLGTSIAIGCKGDASDSPTAGSSVPEQPGPPPWDSWHRKAGRTALRGGPADRHAVTMTTIKQAAAEFLAHKRIAVTGVSRSPKAHGSNIVYQRLRQRGYEVFPVNPNADEVEGDPCYQDLKSIPGGVDAVVIGTRPEIAEATMRECAELGIQYVWMHRLVGQGSVSQAAADSGRNAGITVIDGGCPLMFDPTADAGHKAMRFMFTLTGNVPRRV
jgi:uncharacterized protein